MRFPTSRLSVLLLALSFAARPAAKAALLAYEPFTNAVGTAIIGSSDGFGFSGVWQSNSSGGVATNTGFGLSYIDGSGNSLITAGGSGFFQGQTTANSNMQPIRLFGFSRGTNGTDGVTTWISFLAVRQGPTVAGNNPYPRGANVPHDINAGAIQKLAIGNSTGAPTNTVGLIPLGNAANLKASTVVFSVTNFIVVRVDHVSAGLDNAYLFMNPNLSAEPTLAQANTNSLGTFDFSFDRLRMFAGGNASAAQPYAEMVVDEYRIGETWADVTPYIPGVPPPAFAITNVALIPGNIVLSGTGGSNNGMYLLLATNNLAEPFINWPAIATNNFDANGNFILTNPIAPGSSLQFYRLRIGGSSSSPPDTNAFFVSPDGNDLNPGTVESPFKTLTKGLNTIGNGGLLYLRAGTYLQSSKLTLSGTGSAANTIRIWAYPGEVPSIDSTGDSSDGISISGRYYHLKGLEQKNAGHNGINISGHSNIVENCRIHDNGNTGLHITGGQDGTKFPSYNLILNCDSYLNYDPPVGENADGFSAKWDLGPGNIFRGCRASTNSDDGWDLWMGTSPVVIENCWAYRNGVDVWFSGQFDGNGNGFKLGGNFVPTPHTVKNCVSFENEGGPTGAGRGFDENNNLAGQTLFNCIAYDNRGNNFHFGNTVTNGQHLIRNCISFVGNVNITSGTRDHNSWDGFSVSGTDFVSLDTSLADAPRGTNGSLPTITLLHLVPAGPMVNAGIDVGLPYNGPAPDLGAFETP